jgi:hypothetical protein
MNEFFRLALCIVLLSPVQLWAADNLLLNGGFEAPTVQTRLASGLGGDPATAKENNSWTLLKVNPLAEGGNVTAGLTNEIARTGKQAFFVDFEKLTAVKQQVQLQTGLIPVKAGSTYKISIHGRIDHARPLSLDERRVQMWLDIEFLLADRETPAADSEHTVQLLPGSVVPGSIIRPKFRSTKWTSSSVETKAPANAAFVRLTWAWVIGSDEGETDGVIYWDDAAIEEVTAAPEKKGE